MSKHERLRGVMHQRGPWLWLSVLFFAVTMALPNVELGAQEEGEDAEDVVAEEGDEDGAGLEDELEEELEDAGPPTMDEQEEDLDEDFLGDEEEYECTAEDLEEMKLLAMPRERSEGLRKREILLEEKQAVLQRLEDELIQKFDSLTGKLAALEQRLEIGQAARLAKEERFQTLIEALRTLSARKAAPILNKSDIRFATRLLLGLGAERVAKLLAVMDPQRAAALMRRLASATTPEQAAARGASRDWDAAK